MTLSRFLRNTQGNVAMLFAVMAVALFLLVGMSLDVARAGNMKMQLQSIADSAALAAMSVGTDTADRVAAATDYYNGQVDTTDFLSIVPDFDPISDEEFAVTIEAVVPNMLMGLIGRPSTAIEVESHVTFNAPIIQMALVLDVSGSMRHNLSDGTVRLDQMQAAARTLVDLMSDGGTNPDFSAAIVPFTTMVNVGTSNTAFVEGTSHALFSGTSWAGCVMERRSPQTNTASYVPASSGPDGKWQAYIWPPEPNSPSGCLNPGNGTNSGYASIDPYIAGDPSPWTRGPNFNCVRHSISPLTSSKTALDTSINALTSEPNYGTILAPGIAWGLRTLTPTAPFTEGAAQPGARRYMVVLTDGEQTTEASSYTAPYCQSNTNSGVAYHYDVDAFGLDGSDIHTTGPSDYFTPYGYILDSDPFGSSPSDFSDVKDDLYNVTLDACNQAKAEGIEIYTVAVSSGAGPGTTVHSLLQTCASSPSNFYYVTDSASFLAAFRSIADEISDVRLTQ